MQVHNNYIICATQRSGSTLLCSFLSNLDVAGKPEEFFLPERASEIPLSAVTYADYLRQLMSHFATSNGISGVKVMNNTWEHILERLRKNPDWAGLSDLEIIEQVFPNVKYIFMTRRNKFRQAISLSRAEKSRVWEKNKRTSEKPISTLSELHPFYLKNALKRTYERERFWIDFFKKNGIQPLEIEYETLVQEYQTLVPEILDFIGVQTSGDLKVEQNKLKKQADFYTEILIIYYRIYFLLYNFLPEPAFGCLRWIKHRVMAL